MGSPTYSNCSGVGALLTVLSAVGLPGNHVSHYGHVSQGANS